MTLDSFSAFYYGHEISASNRFLNFDEGSGELVAEIAIGAYTLTTLMVAVRDALNAVGTQEYVVTADRTSRAVTIASVANFDLLTSTGTQVGQSAWELLGFSDTADKTGTNSYLGESPSGSSYVTQFPPQDYVASDERQERIDPSVNESASGDIEVIAFGIKKYIEMDLKWITDNPQDCTVIRNNPTGRADAIAFLQYATTRQPMEFMADYKAPGVFESVVIDSLPGSTKGVGYKLRENVNINLKGYYSTGKLVFRVKEF